MFDDNNKTEIETLILNEFPYPIAINYRRLIETPGWQDKTRQLLRLFEYILRTFGLILVSQYLIIDRDQITDQYLNRLLQDKLPKPSLGSWVEIFFATLRVYRTNSSKPLFLHQLFSFFEDADPPKLKKGIKEPFDKLVELRNELSHGLPPQDEEGWKDLFDKAQNYLLAIFNSIRFICNYELIHIIRQDGDLYYYQRYRGQQIQEVDDAIQSKEPLGDGWFYLAKGKPKALKLLKLYPFLIAWGEDADTNLPGIQNDAALLDKFSDKNIQFIATVLWQTFIVETDSFLADFFYNFERSLQIKQRSGKTHVQARTTQLSWMAVRQAALDLSFQQISGVHSKYQKALYLQREDTLHKFVDFLSSTKRCFVLTGKSGVGKSNFVFSLMDEFNQKEEMCFVSYNAARLTATDNISQMISQDLGRQISQNDSGTQNLFQELEQSNEMAGKKLVIVFDAINENVDGKTLLRQIDNMVGKLNYPWLKVVITSRPESWATIKRGVQLAEEWYYREPNREEFGIELPEFTVQIDQFQREELPIVYDLYRTAYQLQTNYQELNPAIRSALRDPLILRLVAEIHRGQKIPDTIQVMDIYNQYLGALLKSERLFAEDINLLEQEIVPLMISDTHYDNKLTSSQINAAQTRDGHSLWELLYNDDPLSSGRKVNDSYRRLVDADILLKLGSFLDYGVGFKYERFYDYFVSRRLLNVLDNNKRQLEAYQKLLSDLVRYPFLWGGTTRVLAGKAKADLPLLIALAYQNDRTSQKMLIEVLAEYGKQNQQNWAEILKLLSSMMQRQVPEQLKDQKLEEGDFTAAQMLAVEVATHISAPEILVLACGEANAQVRNLVVQRIADLWKRDIECGKTTLGLLTDRLARRVLGIPIPNKLILESAISASILIFAENNQNEDAIKPLQEIFLHKGMNTLLPISFESPLGRLINRLTYFLFSSIAIKMVESITSKRDQYEPANITEIAAYYNLPQEKRNVMLELLPLFYDEWGSIEQHRELLHRAAVIDDPNMNVAIVEILINRGLIEPSIAANIIHELFEVQMTKERPSFLAAFLLVGYGEFLVKMDPDSEICKSLFFDYEGLVKQYMAQTQGRVYYRKVYVESFLGYFLNTSYRLFHKANYQMIHEILVGICENEDWELLNSVAYRFRERGMKYPYPVMNSIEPLLMDNREPVVLAIVDILSQLSVRYSDEVADFLDNHQHSQLLKNKLATLKYEGEIMDQAAGGIMYFLLEAATSEFLKDATVLLLGQMAHVKNIKEWISILIAFLTNLSYQNTVFKVKIWPVDVGHKVIRNPYE